MNAHVPVIAAPAINRIPKVSWFSNDFETFCEMDLPDVGADVYSRHSTCKALMLSWSTSYDGPVKQWVPEETLEAIPAEVEDAILDDRIQKRAWNAPFEMAIWKNVFGYTINPESWRCAQVLAMSLALPGKLEKCGPVVDLPEDLWKMEGGRALITFFTKPRKPTKRNPSVRNEWWHDYDKWTTFKAYNRQDTRSETAITRKLLSYDMPAHEWELWAIDYEINQAGVPVNQHMVDRAVTYYEHIVEKRMDTLRELTGLQNPNSGTQFLPWAQANGYPYDDLIDVHVKRAKETTDNPLLKKVLTAKRDIARASPKKYYAFQRAMDRAQGVLRNAFQFAGAGRTWRWAGRLVQLQNLPRPDKFFENIIELIAEQISEFSIDELDLFYHNPLPMLVSAIRACIQAPDGYLLYDADLNAIENRVLGWITDCQKILDVFRDDRDPYIDFATYMYRQNYDELWHEYDVLKQKGKRTISKPAVLGCGYQLGPGREVYNKKTDEWEATGLLGYARNMGVEMTAEEAEMSVKIWRETYVEAVEFWSDFENAAKRCVNSGQRVDFRMFSFDIKGPFLRMHLPSGRPLSYCRPRIEDRLKPWGEERATLLYDGVNDRKQWAEIDTHGGKLTENADQAIARDLLAHGMRKAKKEFGLDLRLHVHDQIVGLAREDEAEEHLRILKMCMEDQPEWAKDLPLGSAGFTTKIWMKD